MEVKYIPIEIYARTQKLKIELTEKRKRARIKWVRVGWVTLTVWLLMILPWKL